MALSPKTALQKTNAPKGRNNKAQGIALGFQRIALGSLNNMLRAFVAAFVGISLATTVGCKNDAARPTPKPQAHPDPLVFRAQDLPFQYDRGETGSAWPVETTGGGVGLLDFDGDSRLDIFLAQGGPLKGPVDPRKSSDVLLRNSGDGDSKTSPSASGYPRRDTVKE